MRTVAGHRAYYEQWASTWEFQALLKMRPVAGDPDLGRAYVDALWPLVWKAGDRPGFVGEVQAMRRRVEENIPPAHADRELKLGRGGLRDVEFAVQLLQLVHGRGDESLRSPATLPALRALAHGGQILVSHAAQMLLQRLAGIDEFLEIDPAFRFEADIDENAVILDRDHAAPARAPGAALTFVRWSVERDPAVEAS